jgi:glycopeptide antibiotics resistance protein
LKRAITAVLLCGYLIVLLDLTLFQYPQPGANVNLLPFRSMAHDLRHGGWELLVNFFGNVVVFLPLGLLLPILWRRWRSALRITLVSFTLSASIETLQYVSGRRIADVDDVILNTLGGVMGYGLWIGLMYHQSSSRSVVR